MAEGKKAQSLAYLTDAIHKEETTRRLYYIGRWPSSAALHDQRDAYDREGVAPLHDIHRAFATPATTSFLRPRPGGEAAAAEAPLRLSSSAPALPPASAAASPLARPGGAHTEGVTRVPMPQLAPAAAPVALPPRTGAAASDFDALCTAGVEGGLVSRRGTVVPATASRASASRTSRGVTGASGLSRLTVASLRSCIGEAVQREVARTSLGDYRAFLDDGRERARQKRLNMPVHLRTGTSPVDMGFPRHLVTEAAESSARPVKMAVDPFWSTDLKKMNDKAGLRIEYERRLAAAVTGSIAPELPHMYPKRHISNPPTPYFRPGVKLQ